MSSGTDAVGSTSDQESKPEIDADADGGSPDQYICEVCQQPLDGDDQRRGEPVHIECGAELRCGISLRRD